MTEFLHALRSGNRYAWLWTLTVTSTIIAAGALILAPFLFTRVNNAQNSTADAVARVEVVSRTNHVLVCALGDLVQLSGGPRQAAIQGPLYHVRAELHFLTAIKGARCTLILNHRSVRKELNRTIRLIRATLVKEEGR